MISVRIPEEIRKYKEKIAFGLTARQIICTVITLLICVPLYFIGKNFIYEVVLSYLIMFISMPLMAIGFIKYNGMPAEKFFLAILKQEVIYPTKRKYKVDNEFRNWDNIAKKEEEKNSKKNKNYLYQRSIELSALLEEAERNNQTIDEEKIKFLTVKNSNNNNNNKNDKNKKKKEEKKENKKLEKLKIQVAEIEEKEKTAPHLLTKKDFNIKKQYNNELLKERKKEVITNKKNIENKNRIMKKRRKAKSTIPRSTQDTIPYIADYDEGLFEVSHGKFSKVYKLQDINYRISKTEEQVAIFSKFGEFLNHFSEDIHFAICIDNRIISIQDIENKIFYKLNDDVYDIHRIENNNILKKQLIAGRNDIQVEKFLTVTISAETPIEALLKFHKIDNEIILNLRKIGSDGKVLTTEERLSYYHDKYRKGKEGLFNIDFEFLKSQGLSSKDYIAPASFEINKKYIMIEDNYCRVLHLCNLPASLSDEFLYELCDNDFPVTTSLNIQPVAQDKGLRIVKKQLTGIEANKIEAEKRAIRAGYNPETIQHSIKDAHHQAELLYDDMINKDQKMFFVTITCMVQASSLDELDEYCKVIESKAKKYTAEMQILRFQQEEGYKITLPFGYLPDKISVDRTLTTESTAIFIPFANQELFQAGGYFYGLNQISRNIVLCNRRKMKTPSGFILGTSGSGKSFATKQEIMNVLLHDKDSSIIIIDPENEYSDFCRAFGGTVLKISADSNVHINPLDMSENYGLDESDPEDISLETKKQKAIKKKSDYIMSIIEKMISQKISSEDTAISPVQKTIIDRCVQRVYKIYLDNDFNPKFIPTLSDLQEEFNKESVTVEGNAIAQAVEYYTKGSMNVFANLTNIDINNRLVVFNVRDLGEQLRQIALIIIFDYIWNKMIENKNKGIETNCYCDEIHVMFQSYYSANFLKQLYKRGRKYGLCITGITQNVEDLLRSEQARGMIGNSDFILMLNQSSEDLKILAAMKNLSEAQMEFVIGADVGTGLLIAENNIVPFVNNFPTDSYLYKLMSTRFGEEMSEEEVENIINTIIPKKNVS